MESSGPEVDVLEVGAAGKVQPLIIMPARTDFITTPISDLAVEDLVGGSSDLAAVLIPRLVRETGPKATNLFLEFFTVPFENRNTRQAYLQAVRQFLSWCEARGVGDLTQIGPVMLAAYREQHPGSPPTVKQHFSALRKLFAWYVEKGVLPSNPAREVRTETIKRGEGKTPALEAGDMHLLFESFDTASVVGLRDRALIGVMAFTFARVGAVVGMSVKDYYQVGKRSYLRLHEKGSKEKDVPTHHRLEEYLDEYLSAAGIVNDGIANDLEGPLFRSAAGRSTKLTERPMRRTDAWAMVQRRVEAAGIAGTFCCHSFRATGITTFLENGGSLETAQYIAGHADSRTTKLYDRRAQRATREDIERIRY